MKNIENNWEKALDLLSEKINPTSYDAHFKNLNLVKVDDIENKIVFSTDNPFSKKAINSRYLHVLEESVEEAFGKKYSAEIKSEDEVKKNTEPEKYGGEEFIFNPRYNFQNFVVGDNNKYAYAAAVAVAEAPAEAYNPLFLYGGSGLGKTHLMHAIGMHVMENYPDYKILYVSSEMFTNEFIKALMENKMPDFKDKYRKIDVLLIDDIQFIEGKESVQNEFFYTFESLFQLNKQIIISSDRAPNELKTIDDRLKSRFQLNIVADISAPDYETRIAILRKKAELAGVPIDDDILDVINLIAEKIKFNIRELEGAFSRVISFSSLTNEKIDLKFAKNILKDIMSSSDYTVTPDTIKKTVCKYYGIKVSDMDSKKKTMNITLPRQVAMYLCKELTDLSLPKIGEAFGGRDHTTVIHACNKITGEMKINDDFKETVNRLKDDISGKL